MDIPGPTIYLTKEKFGTGAGYRRRIDWHVERLCALACGVGRPLTLVVRGGLQMLPRLWARFSQVVLIESDSFSRALKRRRAVITEAGRLRWMRMHTPKGAPIDDLLGTTSRWSVPRTGCDASPFTGDHALPCRPAGARHSTLIVIPPR